jgi:hypothetical protein
MPIPQTPEVATTIATLKKIQPSISPFLQKVLDFVVGILTGVGGDLNVSGDYTKSQTGDILGNQLTFTETVNGSVDLKATPS